MPAILSTRAIKRKVRSVSNIKKITRAMQMVAASKLKKVQVRLMELRPYSDKIREFLQGLAAQVKDLHYPLFQPREKVKKIARCASERPLDADVNPSGPSTGIVLSDHVPAGGLLN